MVRSVVVLLLLCWTCPLLATVNPPTRNLPIGEGPWGVRAYFDDAAMVEKIAGISDPLKRDDNQKYVVLEVQDRAQYRQLLELGLRMAIDEDFDATLHTPFVRLPSQVNGIAGFPCYRTVEETMATGDALAAQYPTLATYIDIGDSTRKVFNSAQGYDIKVLKITNSAVGGIKPKIFIQGSIHPRELVTAETVTRFGEYLLSQYGIDPDVTWIVDQHEIHLLLITNPDGRKRAEAGASWRKNENSNFCPGQSSGNAQSGIDLNRNYAFDWGLANASNTNIACDLTYRGPSAMSESETTVVANYVRSIFPDQRAETSALPPDFTTTISADATGVYLDIHSFASDILWPWGSQAAPVMPNAAALQSLGRKYAFFNHYTPIRSTSLYAAAGTTLDYYYGTLGIAAMAFELGGNGFSLSCADYDANHIVSDNLAAFLYGARVARAPYRLPAGPDVVALTATPNITDGVANVRLSAILDDTRYSAVGGLEAAQNIAGANAFIGTLPWTTATASALLSADDGSFSSSRESASSTLLASICNEVGGRGYGAVDGQRACCGHLAADQRRAG
jgi:carboxypeptidase T